MSETYLIIIFIRKIFKRGGVMKSSEKKVAIIEIVTLVIILLDIFVTNKIGYLGISILLGSTFLISIGLINKKKNRIIIYFFFMLSVQFIISSFSSF